MHVLVVVCTSQPWHVNRKSTKDWLFGTTTYSSWREGMRANIPSVISEIDPFTKLLLENRNISWTCLHRATQQTEQVPTLQGSAELNASRLLERNITRCTAEDTIQCCRRNICISYSQWVDLAWYSPGDLCGTDTDDSLLGAGASWRTFEISFNLRYATNTQKGEPGEQPLPSACHVDSWTSVIKSKAEVDADNSFYPHGRHPNAAPQRKALTQTDTAAAASWKAPSDGGVRVWLLKAS